MRERLVRLWVGGAGLVIAVVLVALMALVVGTPAWWVSLIVTVTVAAVVSIWVIRVLRLPDTAVAVAVCVVVLGAAGGLVGVSLHDRSDARSAAASRTEVGRVGAQMVCRVIERGTPARQAAALASATGDLADRLRSGAAVLGVGGVGEARCRPVDTGVTAASTGDADVVTLVEVTADGATTTRAVTAGLRRVDGRWLVASLQVVR
jgi:hypothetical protein